MTQSLSGQLYIDPKDSGDLLMFVCDYTLNSDRVDVTPVGLHRMWPRGRDSVIPLIDDFKTHTLPKLQRALATVNGGTIQYMQSRDVDRVLALAKDSGIAEVTICQWLLGHPLLPNDAVVIVVARATLQDIVCPDCHRDRVAGPDEDGCYDCTDCGRCFELEDAHAVTRTSTSWAHRPPTTCWESGTSTRMIAATSLWSWQRSTPTALARSCGSTRSTIRADYGGATPRCCAR